MKKVILSVTAASLLLFSCNKTENDLPIPEIPVNYQFEREGTSTVSFGGQTTRIQMGNEFVSALTMPTENLTSLSGKFSHNEGENNFSTGDLNSSSKNIRSKVAASTDFYASNTTDAKAIKDDFDDWIAMQADEVFPNWDVNASAGVAGKIQEAGGGKLRYVNAKGLELNQMIAKSLIGGLMVDQIVNNYLSPAVLDAGTNKGDNDANVLLSGKNYTSMEHKWDEAFGYLYGNEPDVKNPVLNQDSFLNKYLSRVESDSDFAGIAGTIYDAFKLGRAAIVSKNYAVRDAQAEIIKEKISEIIGVRAVYYLQQSKSKLANNKGAAFHGLSEGIGFIYSLQFTRKPNSTEPYFTKAEVDSFVATLMDNNGFWDVTETTLDDISNAIVAKFNFTLNQAAN